MIFELIGGIIALWLFYLWSQSHNQPVHICQGSGMRCAYCPWWIKAGQKMVHGHKGWGHVECVPKVRRRVFNRW